MATQKTGTISGTLLIAPTNSPTPTIQEQLAAPIGTIVAEGSGEVSLTAGAAAKTIYSAGSGPDFGAGTTASLVKLEARDATTGAARSVTVTLKTTADTTGMTFASTDLVYVAAENADVTDVLVTPQAAGNDTQVKWAIAGN